MRPVCKLAEVIGNKHKLSGGRGQSFYDVLKPGCYQQGEMCAITGVAPVKDPSLHK
jgi:hypothetical protein